MSCWLALAASGVEGADRALLIGIEKYQDPRVSQTPGSELDARALASLLQKSFDFPADSIRILIDEQATSSAIIDNFESWLIDGSGPGDRIFFSYAGHGSRRIDDNGDEDDGYDETLAPYDVDPMTGDRQIRDDQIDALIARLAGRRAVLVFDSCHSGTVTRGAVVPDRRPGRGGVRFLPGPEEFRRVHGGDSTEKTRTGRAEYVVSGSGQGSDHRVFDRPEDDARISGIVTISAAGPGQLAYPIDIDGKARGALSYLFEEVYRDREAGEGRAGRGFLDDLKQKALENLGGTAQQVAYQTIAGASPEDLGSYLVEQVTVDALQSTIDAGFQQLQSSGRLEGDQEPWFEVISEQPIGQQPLFGDWTLIPEVSLGNPVSPMRVEIRTVGGRRTFTHGETLSFDVTVDRDGHLYLLVFSEERVATCIFPNEQDRLNSIDVGTVRVPTSGNYNFPVQEPYGNDLVVALVSERPIEGLCNAVDYTWDEIFERVDLRATYTSLREQVQRGIGVQSTPTDGSAASEEQPKIVWQTSAMVVETTP